MLASDDANPQFTGAHDPDAVLLVKFHNKAVEVPFESSKAGRPIFKDMVYCEITTPGIPTLNVIDRPMRDTDKMRFPRQWMAFEMRQKGMPSGEIGTPLDQWPFLSMAQAEELKSAKFHTVESIANASDQTIGSIGMLGGMAPLQLRERARAFLNAAAGTAGQEHAAAELAKRDATIAAMQTQIAALMRAQGVLGGQTIPVPNAQAEAVAPHESGRPILRKPDKVS